VKPDDVISPADMVLFAAVVREGSFTRAAQAQGLTKQTVSERIANLEARLGARLLERTTRRLRLTDAGASYAEACAAIAAQIDEANRAVQRVQSEPVGLLRVSAPFLYGRRFLMPVVRDFLREHPRLRVEIVLADRRVNLVDEGFDVAIRVGELDDSGLVARKLGEAQIHYVASPAFLARHFADRGAPSQAADLRDVPCIGMRPVETWELFGASRKVTPVLVVNDLEAANDAALAGLGIARIPSLVCGEAVRRKRLGLVFGEEATATRPFYAVFPSRRYVPAKVRLFVDALAARGA
jgi:DNA-binding transcriptional LysR family regulator